MSEKVVNKKIAESSFERKNRDRRITRYPVKVRRNG